ncbi:MAG: hypothetical protein KBA47_00240 [Caldisericia bacterium]|nr:hypothetical protein [Caldisericia bacterium]
MSLLGSLFEAAVGAVLIVIPEPATTGAGVVLLSDGVRRGFDEIFY